MDSPKTRFLRTTHAKQFTELTASPIFDEGLDVALAQFIYSHSNTITTEQAAAKQHQLEGALRFMALIKSIGKPDEIAKAEPIGQLRETA